MMPRRGAGRLPVYLLPALAVLALAVAAGLLWLQPADPALAQDDARPKITAGPAIASSPASGDTYRAGEAITVTLTYGEPVTVTGKPRLRLKIGDKKRWARYQSTGADGATLSFTHAVKPADADADGISIGKNQLKLNGGTIADADGNAARLKHPKLAAQAGHKVNGAPDEPAPPQPEPEPTATPTPEPQPQREANNEPQFAGDTAARSVNENSAAGTSVGAAVTATDDDSDNLTYALTGADAGSFNLDAASGQITVKAALNYEGKASYTVTVTVHDGKDAAGEADTGVDDTIAVTISVINVDEPGVVSLLTENDAFEVGNEITAVLLDPDGGVNGETWIWQHSADGNEWIAIADATGAAYTPTDDDADHYLRATASYADGQGSGKTARGQTSGKVAAVVAAEPVPAEPQNAGPNAVTVQANWSLIPKDSNSKAIFGPGESFRLLFITSTTRNAEPTDIGTYNSFVQARANAISALQPFKSEFRVVGSTGDVDARDNTATTGTGVPIYWVAGAKVADHYGDFYDNSWDSYAGKTESGAAVSTNIQVWTGSNSNGTKTPRTRLGGAGASFQRVFYGALEAGKVFNNPIAADRSNRSKPFYALSPVITVYKPPGPPEPQTVLLGSSPLIPRDSNGRILFKVGESFRLLFVTTAGRNGASSNIADYNSLVQGTEIHVLQSIKGELRALASTAAVDARDNTATAPANGTSYAKGEGVPIYWISGLNTSGDKVTYGAKVADDYADFYDGDWDDVNGTIGELPVGSQPPGIIKAHSMDIWTGSNSNGTKHTNPLGGGANAGCGRVSDSSKNPINKGNCPANQSQPLYALSPVLTVDTEPVSPARYTVTPGNRVAAVHWTIPRWDDTLARWQYRYKAGSGEYINWRNMAGSSINSWNYTVRGLTNGTAYTIQIRAVDKRGVAGKPSEEQIVTPYALTAPTARTVPANWGLIPEGVKPGQSFRLMFITYDRTKAESKHIDTYNSFVQAQAAKTTGGTYASKAELRPTNISDEFRALMSTATVNARDNTATTGRGVPIYWVGGEKVADNYADFYDGSWDKPSYGYHQSGHEKRWGLVWTGSNANGTAHGHNFASGFLGRVGWGTIINPNSRIGGGFMAREELNNLYAISPVLTVATN